MTFTIMQATAWIAVGGFITTAFFGILEFQRYRRAKRLGPIRPDQLHDVADRLRGIAGTLDRLAYDESEAASVGTAVPGPTAAGASGPATGGARATA
ncbi:MAG TPA: hypothetical protein VNA20_00975 [Frankiaceae bacterium]|nr:hypothetical protein [Frankiaceae bacterium]